VHKKELRRLEVEIKRVKEAGTHLSEAFVIFFTCAEVKKAGPQRRLDGLNQRDLK